MIQLGVQETHTHAAACPALRIPRLIKAVVALVVMEFEFTCIRHHSDVSCGKIYGWIIILAAGLAAGTLLIEARAGVKELGSFQLSAGR